MTRARFEVSTAMKTHFVALKRETARTSEATVS